MELEFELGFFVFGFICLCRHCQAISMTIVVWLHMKNAWGVFFIDIVELFLTPIIAWQCKKLSSSLGPKWNLNLSSSFLFFCFFVFGSIVELHSVSIVTQLCMRNPNSSSDLILDPHLSLVSFFFSFFCCKHYQATLGIENRSVMQFEFKFQLGYFVVFFSIFLSL